MVIRQVEQMITEQRLAKIIAAARYQLAAEIAIETVENGDGMYAGDDLAVLTDRSLRYLSSLTTALQQIDLTIYTTAIEHGAYLRVQHGDNLITLLTYANTVEAAILRLVRDQVEEGELRDRYVQITRNFIDRARQVIRTVNKQWQDRRSDDPWPPKP